MATVCAGRASILLVFPDVISPRVAAVPEYYAAITCNEELLRTRAANIVRSAGLGARVRRRPRVLSIDKKGVSAVHDR